MAKIRSGKRDSNPRRPTLKAEARALNQNGKVFTRRQDQLLTRGEALISDPARGREPVVSTETVLTGGTVSTPAARTAMSELIVLRAVEVVQPNVCWCGTSAVEKWRLDR
jgi:hypothetical protein